MPWRISHASQAELFDPTLPMTNDRTALQHGQIVSKLPLEVRSTASDALDTHVYTVEGPDGDAFKLLDFSPAESHLEPAEQYWVENAIVVRLDRETTDATADSGSQCPECGTELEPNLGSDQLLNRAHSILTEKLTEVEQTVHLIGTPETAYRPRSADDRRDPSEGGGMAADLEYVCPSCGLLVAAERESTKPDWHEFTGHDDQSRTDSPTTRFFHDRGLGAGGQTLGLASGGNTDVGNFRENLKNGYLPGKDAISFEGLFYEYDFDVGEQSVSDSTFYPTYSTATSTHPITGKTEHYLAVGLGSNLSADSFDRQQLNLVVALDVSGSMSSDLDTYHADATAERDDWFLDDPAQTKIAAAKEALCAVTTQLQAVDRLGIVLYNEDAHVALPLRQMSDLSLDQLHDHIRTFSTGGGTDMRAGLEAAYALFPDSQRAAAGDVENRLIFVTDMLPNTGQTERHSLRRPVECAADAGVYTTFLGVGLDENPALAEELSTVRGANHYFVSSAAEFRRRLDDEFEYMVTPLAFDLQLSLEDEHIVDDVFGATGQNSNALIEVPTLFPSPASATGSQGSVILLRLSELPKTPLGLTATWTERDGATATSRLSVSFEQVDADRYGDVSVRKAICLVRYAERLRTWAETAAERSENDVSDRWERSSTPIGVRNEERTEFERLREYLADERSELAEPALDREVAALEAIISHGSAG